MTTRWFCGSRFRRWRLAAIGLLAGLGLLTLHWGSVPGCQAPFLTEQVRDVNKSLIFSVTTEHPFVFIGGMPRSGTTMVRTILDSHSAVRCGVETRVVPRLLQLLAHWENEKLESERLRAAGILGESLDAATAAFIMQVLMRNGPPASRLCSKDPYSLAYSRLLSRLFPNAKFILMLRDGRAFVHSAISRNVRITGYDFNRPMDCLSRWNLQIRAMFRQCMDLGSSRCLTVRYEDLVLDPPRWVGRIAEFLGIQVEPAMLTPWQEVGGQVRLSKTERSTDQVSQPFYLRSLSSWTSGMSAEFVLAAPRLAPMLATLGYDTERLPPRYGRPNPEYWRNATYY